VAVPVPGCYPGGGLGIVSAPAETAGEFPVFVGTFFPVLGFLNVYPFIYFWVADHFVYLASLGIILPVASGLTAIAERNPRGRPILATSFVTILSVLSILARRQSSMYQSAETLYRQRSRGTRVAGWRTTIWGTC
jgi:hypothetical protein